MSMDDFTFAVRLTDTMNWSLSEEDFKFIMELEPDGCFVILDDSERIGVATTISYDRVGWLGNTIVSESHRERGAGSLLVRHSIEHLTNKNIETIGLYSYIKRIPFYTKLGFEYDTEFVVLKGKGFSAPTKACLREARKDDIPNIADLDSLCFGASRRKLLEPILLCSNNLCYISIEDERILGFAVAKVYDGMVELGPLVCHRASSDVAIDLLKATLNRLQGFEVSMCIPEEEYTILKMLTKFGFRESFRVARMFFGHPIIKDYIYVAESLERG